MDNDIDGGAGGGRRVSSCSSLAPGLSWLSDDELTVGYDEALAASRQAEWARLAVEAEISRRGMYLGDGTVSLREWICIRTGEGDRSAYQHDRIARRLGDFPLLSAALADGRVSVAHVGVLLTLARLAGTDDDRLVELGETRTVPQLETMCRAARPVSPAADDDGHRRRHLRWRYDDHGSVRLHGHLHGAEALTVTNLIAAMAETVDEPCPGEGPASFDARCADALVELCTAQINHSTARRAEIVIHVPLHTLTDPHPDPDPDPADPPGEPADQRPDGDPVGDSRHDRAPDPGGAVPDRAIPGDNDVAAPPAGSHPAGSDRCAGSHPAGSHPAGSHPAGSDRCAGFDLHGPDPHGLDRHQSDGHEADRQQSDRHLGAATTADGTALSSAALQRLLCDCSVRLTVDDAQGRAVGIGFRGRNLPRWLLNQLRWRDGSCRFPGCERTRWVHGHHLVHWPHGPTDLGNLMLVCSAHHRMIHEGGWHVHGDPDNQLTFTSPTGHTYITQPATHPKPPPRRRRRETSPAPPGRTSNGP